MNYLKLIIGISSMLYFTSCESDTVVSELFIENSTNSIIMVDLSPETSYTIASKDSELIHKEVLDKYIGDPFTRDSVRIVKSDLQIIYLLKNINSEKRNIFNIQENWEEEVISNEKNNSHYRYTYIVKEEDFVNEN